MPHGSDFLSYAKAEKTAIQLKITKYTFQTHSLHIVHKEHFYI
ncbi:hypothetical protein PPIS_a3324 [Pseudoalteromonas piscicida]|uniref:Uncharacterized protein n=1 Tax=Pseudoalteromonas piscicida TaxID=43662 RepID=A0ABM6NGN6_PSEO7|nr:hypothetical protein PPIS_a3324 [Pseudoalteromonas piscicida]MBE0374609.1 hypothetical protein [Pseudoalteromonas flavipulchra NCIMB 2033 = ATCC BAA-314]